LYVIHVCNKKFPALARHPYIRIFYTKFFIKAIYCYIRKKSVCNTNLHTNIILYVRSICISCITYKFISVCNYQRVMTKFLVVFFPLFYLSSLFIIRYQSSCDTISFTQNLLVIFCDTRCIYYKHASNTCFKLFFSS